MLARIPKPTRQYALPTFLTKVLEWRRQWWIPPGEAPRLYAGLPRPAQPLETFFLDGSGYESRDPHLRRVGWAVAWRTASGWSTHAGPVAGAQTVFRAELFALLVALQFG